MVGTWSWSVRLSMRWFIPPHPPDPSLQFQSRRSKASAGHSGHQSQSLPVLVGDRCYGPDVDQKIRPKAHHADFHSRSRIHIFHSADVYGYPPVLCSVCLLQRYMVRGHPSCQYQSLSTGGSGLKRQLPSIFALAKLGWKHAHVAVAELSLRITAGERRYMFEESCCFVVMLPLIYFTVVERPQEKGYTERLGEKESTGSRLSLRENRADRRTLRGRNQSIVFFTVDGNHADSNLQMVVTNHRTPYHTEPF